MREISQIERSKARAIVYNAFICRYDWESFVFSVSWIFRQRLLILCAQVL